MSFEVAPQNLNRSCNEAMVLACLGDGPRHGYQLAIELDRRSDGAFHLQHGTLYPILHRLEKKGLIRGRWSAGETRRRKRYELTAAGRRYARAQIDSWLGFVRDFHAVVGVEA